MPGIFSPFFYFKTYVEFLFKRAGLKEIFFENDEYKIQFWDSEESQKPPLILLPAFAAETKYSWYKQVVKLSKSFRVITPNLVYFGKSTKHQKSYTIQDQVDAVTLLMNHLKLERTSIIGTSYGGAIAAEFALQNTGRIEKMILVNGPIKFIEDSEVQNLIKEHGAKDKLELLVPYDHKHLYKLFKIAYHKVPPIPRFVFRDIHKNLYVAGAEEKRKLIRQSDEELEKLRTREYKFDFPVLLIWGEKDRLAPLSIGQKLKEHMGDVAELQTIENAAHMPNYEKPRLYTRLVLDFLNSK